MEPCVELNIKLFCFLLVLPVSASSFSMADVTDDPFVDASEIPLLSDDEREEGAGGNHQGRLEQLTWLISWMLYPV